MTAIKFAAVGDSFITRRLAVGDKSKEEILQLIDKAEAKFANFEMTTASSKAFPSAFSGGTWAKAMPDVLEDIKEYGFNLLAWANNHTLDYSYRGAVDTANHLDQYGFVHAGVGQNLAEASLPRYLDCKSGRVALIAASSTFHESWLAGEQRPDMVGRPGINPLRYTTTYSLKEENIERLKTIAEKIGINAERDLLVEEGFVLQTEEEVFMFGNYRFKQDHIEGVSTMPLEEDMARIIRSINEASYQADYVLVSIHSHEMGEGRKDIPAEFLSIFARECIDAGADAIIGHGPHILRGIEIYKKRPIFYSLGNFIFQSNTVYQQPADFYEKYGLGHRNTISQALNKRDANNTRGLGVNPLVWESIIALWSMNEDGLRELLLYPIELGFNLPLHKRGWPMLTKNIKPLERLKELSLPFGTNITIENSIARVQID